MMRPHDIGHGRPAWRLRVFSYSVSLCLIVSWSACTSSASQMTRVGDAGDGNLKDAGDSGRDAGLDDAADVTHEEVPGEDVAPTQDAEGDRDARLDASDVFSPDTHLPQSCEGACRQQELTLDYAGKAGELQHAAFGLTAPARATSGQWELYVEAWDGGFSGCPQQASPTPDWMLILTGLQLPLDRSIRTKTADDLSLVFLDFQGFFFEDDAPLPFVRANEIRVAPVAAHVDVTRILANGTDEDSVVALTVAADFDDGQIAGHLVATHCPSMDELD